MNCYIHRNREASASCRNCKRHICFTCAKTFSSLCPRCSNYEHQTITSYNKKWLLPLLIFVIFRLLLTYDAAIYLFFSDKNTTLIRMAFIIQLFFMLPFLFFCSKTSIKETIHFLIFGKRKAVEVTEQKKKLNLTSSILSFFMIGIVTILSYYIHPIFLFLFSICFLSMDIIHLVILIRDYLFHKKRIVTDQFIINL